MQKDKFLSLKKFKNTESAQLCYREKKCIHLLAKIINFVANNDPVGWNGFLKNLGQNFNLRRPGIEPGTICLEGSYAHHYTTDALALAVGIRTQFWALLVFFYFFSNKK